MLKPWRDAFSEYLDHLGRWIWILVVDLVGLGQSLLGLELPVFERLTLEVWAVLTLIYILVANFLIFKRVKEQREEYEEVLDRRDELHDTLSHVADLRTEGVAIRNQGLRIAESGETDTDEWDKAREKWREDVLAALADISESVAENFKTHDWVPGFVKVEDRPVLQKKINMLSHDTQRLSLIIQRHQPSLFAIRDPSLFS